MNNYDYPEGSDTSKAPWNEKLNTPQTVDICIEETLYKETTVTTNDYEEIQADNQGDQNKDGSYDLESVFNDLDFSNTNWAELYKDQHLTALELIQELCKCKLREIENLKQQIQNPVDPLHLAKSLQRLQRATYIVNECSSWESESNINQL